MPKIHFPTILGAGLILFLAGFNLGFRDNPFIVRANTSPDNFEPNLRLFSEIMALVQDHYVDEEKVATEELFKSAINGMLQTLDPHSQWLQPKSYSEFQVETQGQFGGLGIKIDIVDNWLTVVQPLEDTPAMKAGLRAGDKIIEIEGESTRGITVEDAVNRLRGPQGSKVSITVMRRTRENRDAPWRTERNQYTIVRDIIKISSIPAHHMLSQNIGYIRLSEFRAESGTELLTAMKALEDRGMEGLILDLRFNQGGLLNVAVEVASAFLPGGKPVVSIRDRKEREEIHRSRGRVHVEYPIAVLVNQWSASASEIVAGALQDHHRAIIIGPAGAKTFGKGSVQTVEPLYDNSALKLTTALYYTPKGRSIHGSGLIPDIEVDVDESHEFRLIELNRMGIPSATVAESLKNAEASPQTEPEPADPGLPIRDEDVFPDSGEPSVVTQIDEDKQTWDDMTGRAVEILHSYRIMAGRIDRP